MIKSIRRTERSWVGGGELLLRKESFKKTVNWKAFSSEKWKLEQKAFLVVRRVVRLTLLKRVVLD